MREKSLMERLRKPGRDAEIGESEDIQALADSIQRHLQKMMNCRTGHSLTVPDFGIPDLTEIATGFPESSEILEETIRDSIEKFEPRLRNVTVKFVEEEGDILTISFEITAQLVSGKEDLGVWFMTKIGTDGRVEIRG